MDQLQPKVVRVATALLAALLKPFTDSSTVQHVKPSKALPGVHTATPLVMTGCHTTVAL
jgi:hypothetical protein